MCVGGLDTIATQKIRASSRTTSSGKAMPSRILEFMGIDCLTRHNLHGHDRSKAVEILVKDLKVFSTFNEELFKEITQLLTLENFRENEQLSKYGDTKSARAIMLVELKKLIEANPLFRDKLQFPNLRNSRLRTLINQSLNWQHQLCKNPRPNPDIKTLFVDHSCGQPNGARAPSPANNPLLGALPKAGGFPPLGAHGPFQPPQAQAPVPAPLAGWMSSSSTVAHPAASGGGPIGLGGPSMPAALKHPRTPPSNPALDYPSGDSDHSYLLIIVDIPQVNLPVNVMPVSFQSHGHGHGPAFNAPDDLPKTVARTLNQARQIIGTAQEAILVLSLIMLCSPRCDFFKQTVLPPTKFAQFAPAGEMLDFMFAPAGQMLDSSSSEAAKLLHSFISSASNPRLYIFNLKSN
ncbi:hypothetical protein ACFE04_013400 [Oxalis oulophora]